MKIALCVVLIAVVWSIDLAIWSHRLQEDSRQPEVPVANYLAGMRVDSDTTGNPFGIDYFAFQRLNGEWVAYQCERWESNKAAYDKPQYIGWTLSQLEYWLVKEGRYSEEITNYLNQKLK